MIHLVDDSIPIQLQFLFQFSFSFSFLFYSVLYVTFYFIVKIITFVVINSAYTYNYHKLFCSIVVAFCAVVIPLVFLTYKYYRCFCFVCFLSLYLLYLYFIYTISTFCWIVFDPCKVLLNVNK